MSPRTSCSSEPTRGQLVEDVGVGVGEEVGVGEDVPIRRVIMRHDPGNLLPCPCDSGRRRGRLDHHRGWWRGSSVWRRQAIRTAGARSCARSGGRRRRARRATASSSWCRPRTPPPRAAWPADRRAPSRSATASRRCRRRRRSCACTTPPGRWRPPTCSVASSRAVAAGVDGVVPAVPVTDTIKLVDDRRRRRRHPDRASASWPCRRPRVPRRGPAAGPRHRAATAPTTRRSSSTSVAA